ncbi:cation diffusion facilitator family transporter [bacterium]|nr:cation diffusion facilitator family transporter [bacterium]
MTWSSILLNFALFALKLWAGLISRSVTLLADAWHTLSDSISSIVVLVAIRVSKKPADDDHPYGHGRAEVIAAVLVGALLAFVSFHFLVESISKLWQHESAQYGNIAVWVTITGVLVKELLARLSIRLGKKAGSRALIADGWHHRSDALSSIIVLVGIFLGSYWWFIDGLMGILISLFIAYVSYDVLRDSISALLGEQHDEKILLTIQKLCNEVAKRDVQAHHLQIHEYGDHLETVFHIRLPGHWSLDRVHEVVDELEAAIESKYGGYVNIHVDPIGVP